MAKKFIVEVDTKIVVTGEDIAECLTALATLIEQQEQDDSDHGVIVDPMGMEVGTWRYES